MQEEPALAPAEAAQVMGEEVVGLLRTLPEIVQVRFEATPHGLVSLSVPYMWMMMEPQPQTNHRSLHPHTNRRATATQWVTCRRGGRRCGPRRWRRCCW